jgi:hypothetical protein
MNTGELINLVGVLIALAALLATLGLGIKSYKDDARATRLGHMHRLFGDYLAHEFDYQLARRGGEHLSEARRSLNAFKMYTLEEMWLWLENEQRYRAVWPRARADRERLVTGWTNTIEYHLSKSTVEDICKFLLARRCYSEGFVGLLLNQPDVRARLEPTPEESDESHGARLRHLLRNQTGEPIAADGLEDIEETAAFIACYYKKDAA